jgi:hypothetical protein
VGNRTAPSMDPAGAAAPAVVGLAAGAEVAGADGAAGVHAA